MEYKKSKLKNFGVLLVALLMMVCLAFGGCSLGGDKGIAKIEKTGTSGLTDIYTITYTDGSTYQFYIENGKDGADATSPSIQDIYNEYIRVYGDITYDEFLKLYLKSGTVDNTTTINNCLQSCLKLYSEFKITETIGWGIYENANKRLGVSCGSGVIYKIDNDYTYVLTNYHVVYNASAGAANGGKIASAIRGYLYGSEEKPYASGVLEDGYDVYSYGDYAIDFEYVGGAVEYDIAIVRAHTSDVIAINENVKAVTLADSYHVGQTAIAIGNPENEGISATEGIISVDNEYINLDIDGNIRSYRSIRIDTAIYEGSSGGGLFNSDGELIGITNAGDNDDQNVNYAIPLEIIKNVVENLLFYYDGTTPAEVKKVILGITVDTSNSKYVYDESKGYGQIVETITIESVTGNSIFAQLGIQDDDILISLTLNGVETKLNRDFEIGNVTLQVRPNDTISATYKRGAITAQTSSYIVKASDLT